MKHAKNKLKSLDVIRRDYGTLTLSEDEVLDDPFDQFERWFSDVLEIEDIDPTAMVLSTVDEKGCPDSRVVLLKGLEDRAFTFYTNYQSTKAVQIDKAPCAALNFYWPKMARQVRVRGRVKQTTSEQSDVYFLSRPKTSQIGSMASYQSQVISNRNELEQRFATLVQKYEKEPITRPSYWGGYVVLPDEVEFWQGRDNRLHDRIHYYQSQGNWLHHRLAP